jgi:hypothetical protein
LARANVSAGIRAFLIAFLQPTTHRTNPNLQYEQENKVIRKLKSGEYRLYSRKKDSKTGKRKNLGTFSTMEKAKKHEKAVHYFKRAG